MAIWVKLQTGPLARHVVYPWDSSAGTTNELDRQARRAAQWAAKGGDFSSEVINVVGPVWRAGLGAFGDRRVTEQLKPPGVQNRVRCEHPPHPFCPTRCAQLAVYLLELGPKCALPTAQRRRVTMYGPAPGK